MGKSKYSQMTKDTVLNLIANGHTHREIWRACGVPLAIISKWRNERYGMEFIAEKQRQQRVKKAAEDAGIHSGMSRSKLIEAMKSCAKPMARANPEPTINLDDVLVLFPAHAILAEIKDLKERVSKLESKVK